MNILTFGGYTRLYNGIVLAYVQGVAADEEADERFCQRMIENHESALDEDKEGIPLEKCLKEWGLD